MTTLRDQIKAIIDFRTPNPASDFFQLIDPFVLTTTEIATSITPTNFSYPPGHVFRYGAVADGSGSAGGTGTDNTVAFNNAIAAVGIGGQVTIPAGTFLVGKPTGGQPNGQQISVPRQVTFGGAGNFSTILVTPSTFNRSDGLIITTGALGGPPAVVRDMTISGPGGGAGASSLGVNTGTNATLLINLWVTSFAVLSQVNANQIWILNCTFEQTISGGTGLNIGFDAVIVDNCVFSSCNIGIFINAPVAGSAGGSTIQISNTEFTALASTGILLSATPNVQIDNCSIAGATNAVFVNAGIQLTGACTNILISNLYCTLGTVATSAIGILVGVGASQILINGAVISGWQDGINISNCTDVTIANVQATGNHHRGIVVSSGDRIILNGCDATLNGTGAANDAGIAVNNASSGATYALVGCVTVSNGTNQQYGLSVTAAAGSLTTVTGHIAAGSSVADIAHFGTTKAIRMSGCLPHGAQFSSQFVTIGAASYVFSNAEEGFIANFAGACTVTLPNAGQEIGRSLLVKTITANTVISNASNVVPLAGGAAGTAILAATAGKWAILESDGTNWQIMAAN